MFFRQLLQRLGVLLERGVVYQDVELPEFLHCRLDRIAAEFGVAHVAGDQQRAPSLALHCFARFFRVFLLLRQMNHHHVGAFARIEHRHGTADAGVPAGDDRHLVLQLLRPAIVWREVLRAGLYLRFQAGWLLMLPGKRRLRTQARYGPLLAWRTPERRFEVGKRDHVASPRRRPFTIAARRAR
ncbi:MAG TPA: hypothetical protein VFA60_16240 [Terriglobales bacterium]|nr:hypothetical protein [Terriglobales bacterium]